MGCTIVLFKIGLNVRRSANSKMLICRDFSCSADRRPLSNFATLNADAPVGWPEAPDLRENPYPSELRGQGRGTSNPLIIQRDVRRAVGMGGD
jgi:hypothetical protein